MSKSDRSVPPLSADHELEPASAGLAKRYGWLAGVLDEMRQFNARMKERHAAPKTQRPEHTHEEA